MLDGPPTTFYIRVQHHTPQHPHRHNLPYTVALCCTTTHLLRGVLSSCTLLSTSFMLEIIKLRAPICGALETLSNSTDMVVESSAHKRG